MKLFNHIRRWNIWRKRNGNNWLHKLSVLLGLVHSPTMNMVWLPEEVEAWSGWKTPEDMDIVAFAEMITGMSLLNWQKNALKTYSKTSKEGLVIVMGRGGVRLIKKKEE